jgi:tryptophanyl-tRNA synthetase
MIETLVTEIRGMRQRAQEFEEQPELIDTILSQGAEKARDTARETIDEVRRVVHLRAG